MSNINPSALVFVGAKLDSLGIKYAFVGGSIVNLLLDHPELSPVRPTDDLDIIVEVLTTQRYSDVEEKLRASGFQHDTRAGSHICRWVIGGLTLDVMPTEGALIGLNTAWFAEALASATTHRIGETLIPVISPAAFIATKFAAFNDRGNGDYFASHDLEDLMTVIDGRAKVVAEISNSAPPLREFIADSVRKVLENADFQEALPAYLPSDRASQKRLPQLRAKLVAIAKI